MTEFRLEPAPEPEPRHQMVVTVARNGFVVLAQTQLGGAPPKPGDMWTFEKPDGLVRFLGEWAECEHRFRQMTTKKGN